MKIYNPMPADFRRHTLDLTDQERMRLMEEQIWIPYPIAASILGRLESLLHTPPQDRMPCLLIIGKPNNGKTRIIREFCKMHGKHYVDENNDPVKPIIVAQTPPSVDQKSLYTSLLKRYHAPYRPTEHVIDLHDRTIHKIRECRTRMIIIDEFHSLLTGKGKKLAEVLDAIKLFCNDLRIPIVGVGTEEAKTVFDHDAQMSSRFGIVELPPWKRDPQFQKLLIAFEKALPLKKPSNLNQPQLSRLLHTHSGGILGDLRRLLIECAKAAITSGAEQIDKALIESTEKTNPWRQRSNGT